MSITFRNPVVIRIHGQPFKKALASRYSYFKKDVVRLWRKFFCKHFWQPIPNVELTPIGQPALFGKGVTVGGNLLGDQPFVDQKWCYKCERYTN